MDEDYTIEEWAKDLRRKARAKRRNSRVCWYISICWQILGIIGMIGHIEGANTCIVVGVLWMIVSLLVRREE